VILGFIHDNGDHLTAEEIINYVHGKFPRINKSTIYRTLELLEKNECVLKVSLWIGLSITTPKKDITTTWCAASAAKP